MPFLLSRLPVRHALLSLLGAACVFSAHACAGELVDLLTDDKWADFFIDPSAHDGRCVAGTLEDDSGRLYVVSTPRLEPGRYVARLRLRLSHPVSRYTARMRFALSAEGPRGPIGGRVLHTLAFRYPNRYQEFDLPFTVVSPGTVVDLSVAWGWHDLLEQKRPVLLLDKPVLGDAGVSGEDEGLGAMAIERHLTEWPYHLAMDRVQLEFLGPVFVDAIDVDKIRYAPGETARVSIRVRNLASSARRVTCVTEWIRDMDKVVEADRRELTLAGTGPDATDLHVDVPLGQGNWGREVRCRLLEEGRCVSAVSEYFTVHANPWAVASGGYGINLPYYRAGPDGRSAPRMAKLKKNSYENMIEFVFWAPDDFADLTPEKTPYWSGQMRHQSGKDSTLWLIDAFHKAGIACSFYTRLRVGGGKAGYELYRQRPDLFEPEFYDVRHFDRWDEATDLISWPRLAARMDSDEPYRMHADEIIRSIEMFGWDAARYDSDMSTIDPVSKKPFAARAFPIVKDRVLRAHPNFQWGFNDGLHRMDLSDKPELRELFKVLCEGGGMIMDEYGNHAFRDKWTYEKYARRHVSFGDMVGPLGGHVMFCPSDVEWDNDAVFQEILPLAARAHHAWDPLKGVPPYAHYRQFATRFAGYLWDSAARRVTTASECVDWGEAADRLFKWGSYVHVRPRDEGRSELIVQMLNIPPERASSYVDNRVPAPVENARCRIRLPADVQATAVWCATAEPTLGLVRLPFDEENGSLVFTVPFLRFWNLLVVEMTGDGSWQ